MKLRYQNLISYMAMALLLSLLPNNSSAASIGRVVHAIGEVTAVNQNGQTRTLKRGSYITEGDTIKSGSNSTSQLRMKDGALIALRDNTEFRFDNYKYSNNQETDNTIMSLLKGGFRAITGLIGKKNKNNYQVKTPVATIGIRGTFYGLTYCQAGNCKGPDGTLEDGLYGSVVDGEIMTHNKSGNFSFSNDEYFHLASENKKPRGLIKPPGVIFDQSNPAKKYKKGQDQNDEKVTHGFQLVTLRQNEVENQLPPIDPKPPIPDPVKNSLDNVVQAPKGFVLSYSFLAPDFTTISRGFVADGTQNSQFFLNENAAVLGEFRLLGAVDTFAGALPVKRELKKTTFPSVQDVGSLKMPDGTRVGWGRWNKDGYNSIRNGLNEKPINDLHYLVASAITTPAQIQAITGVFDFKTIAGTRATDLNGVMAANPANVNMNVTLGASATINSMRIITNIDGKTYGAQMVSPTPIISAMTNVSMGGTTACVNCAGNATVGFLGKQAGGAFTTFNIVDAVEGKAASGTVVMAKQ